MKECLSRIMGLLFLVSSVIASESNTRELDSQLRHAAGGGNVATCKRLLSQGAALEGRGRGGVTPLFVASREGHGEVVKLLLGSKAQVDAVLDDGETSLFIASQKGHGDVVKLLLESKAQVDGVRTDGVTSLISATQNGHSEVVKVLLMSKAQVDVALDADVTPLIIASQKGYEEICQLLLDSKAAINRQEEKGKRTALHVAVQHNHLNCVTVLLQVGADVTVCDEDGDTPLAYAAKLRNRELCDLLSRHETETKELDSQLRHIAGGGNVAKCKKLLSQGAKLNGQGQGGVTPLYAASENGQFEVMKLLLGSKAQVDAACDDGATALLMASQKGHSGIVRLLLGSKAQVDAALKDGGTPLCVASQEGHSEVVKLLLESKSQIDVIGGADGVTPLYMASQFGHGGVCQLLLDGKAAINMQTKKAKRTALHTAVQHNHLNCVTVLLKAGADVTACDEDGDTPLAYAAKLRNRELCDLLSRHEAETKELDSQLRHAAGGGNVAKCKKLLSQGAKLNGRCRDGTTPLYVASQEGHCEVVKLLLRSKAQVDAPLDTGATPLLIASQCGHGGVCQLLLNGNAAFNTQTKKNQKTALHTAVLYNHLNCVRVLLKAGADVTACDVHGDTPLVYAARQRNRELCTLLSRYGAEMKASRWSLHKNRKKLAKYLQSVLSSDDGEISSADSDYQSIDHVLSSGQVVSQYTSAPFVKQFHYAKILSTLHTVAQEGDCDKLEMIFGFGVPVDQVNADGYTALHLAVIEGHYAMCSHLLEYGADRNIQAPSGETAHEIAQRIGNKKLIELLDSTSS